MKDDALYGAFEIAKYLGVQKDYVGFSNFFRFCGVPSMKRGKGVKTWKVLAKVFPKHHKKWSKINRKKDKSYSANDFRFWLYLRLLDEKYPMKFIYG